MHYLDNAATTAVRAEVADVIDAAVRRMFANPSSLYRPGAEAEAAIEKARRTVAAALGIAGAPGQESHRVVFTASGTEANNLAILGAARARKGWATELVATGYEHPSVTKPLELLAAAEGFTLTLVPPGPDGVVDPAALLDAVTGKTALVCAMQLNNETGAKLDVCALAAAVKQKNRRTAVHVDGVQAFCKLPVAIGRSEIDSYALSGHKLHAPKGVGALAVRRGFALAPVLCGGGQEGGLRPGTENTPYILGLAEAVKLARQEAPAAAANIAALGAQLLAGLRALPGVRINSPGTAWPGIVNFSLPPLKSEPVLHHLEQCEVYVSSGSACSKGEPSHTLVAMGLAPDLVDAALRVSFCGDNTADDVAALLAGLQSAMATLATGRPRR